MTCVPPTSLLPSSFSHIYQLLHGFGFQASELCLSRAGTKQAAHIVSDTSYGWPGPAWISGELTSGEGSLHHPLRPAGAPRTAWLLQWAA